MAVYDPFIDASESGKLRWWNAADGTPRDMFVDASDGGKLKINSSPIGNPFIDASDGGKLKFATTGFSCASWKETKYIITDSSGLRIGAGNQLLYVFQYEATNGNLITFSPIDTRACTDWLSGYYGSFIGNYFPSDCEQIYPPEPPAVLGWIDSGSRLVIDTVANTLRLNYILHSFYYSGWNNWHLRRFTEDATFSVSTAGTSHDFCGIHSVWKATLTPYLGHVEWWSRILSNVPPCQFSEYDEDDERHVIFGCDA